ncbi:MAG: GC-type dockerin domain-anchored protein [Planctomycetota bacterium]
MTYRQTRRIDRLGSVLTIAVAAGLASAQPLDLVFFFHDQTPDVIYRAWDANGDGDCHDPGEVTVFVDDADMLLGIDNAQGLVALSATSIIATDNFEPDNIVRFVDTNLDGDALDAGEASVFFSGDIGGGETLSNPTDLFDAPDGSFWIVDVTVGVTPAPPSRVYRLEDLNEDQDADDPGERTDFFELAPAGMGGPAIFDLVVGAGGEVYVCDLSDPQQIESIDVIDPAGVARTEWLGSDTLFGLTGQYLFSGTYELEIDPAQGVVYFSPSTLNNNAALLGARDLNGSGDIDAPNEVVVFFDENASAEGINVGSLRDFKRLDDGRFVATDAGQDRVYVLEDLNTDFDFNDAGEIRVAYDGDTAAANGEPDLILPLSIDAAPLPAGCGPGDLTTTGSDLGVPDGLVDLSDFSYYLGLWAADAPRADVTPESTCDFNVPDGAVTLSDFACYLSVWATGCP